MSLDLSLTYTRPVATENWWADEFTGAIWAADFGRALGMVAGVETPLTYMLSEGRNSSQIVVNADGTLTSIEALSLPISDHGLHPWEARTNKNTCFNANPTDLTGVALTGDEAATLSIVSDVEALGTAGLADICTNGMVFKLDNSLGVADANALFTPPGTLNAHSGSIVVRGSGTFRHEIRQTLGPEKSASATYTLDQFHGLIPLVGSRQHQLVATAGAVLFFILQTFEEAAFAGPPIVTQGVAATRLASNIQAIDMSWYPGGSLYILAEIDPTPVATGQVRNMALFRNAGSVNDRVEMLVLTTDKPRLLGYNAASTVFTPVATSSLTNTPTRVAVKVKDNDAAIIMSGATETTDTDGTLNYYLFDQFLIGQNEHSNADYFNGAIRKLAVLLEASVTQAEVEAWTAG